jgi:vacuolar-type H+-ATPase subunit E/Vma4
VSELKSQKRIRGGLLGVSSDGKMEIDLTFDTIFQSERENIESLLAEKIKGD